MCVRDAGRALCTCGCTRSLCVTSCTINRAPSYQQRFHRACRYQYQSPAAANLSSSRHPRPQSFGTTVPQRRRYYLYHASWDSDLTRPVPASDLSGVSALQSAACCSSRQVVEPSSRRLILGTLLFPVSMPLATLIDCIHRPAHRCAA